MTKLEITTLILGIIGCVSGVSALLIQFSGYLLSKPQIKVALDTAPSYFFNLNEFEVEGNYPSQLGAFVSLRIENGSSYPITVHEITTEKGPDKTRHLNFDYKILEIPAPGSSAEQSKVSFRQPSKPFDLPLRIDPFDTVYGSASFPIFSKIVGEEFKDCEYLVSNIVLHTPRNQTALLVKLPEYHICCRENQRSQELKRPCKWFPLRRV